MQEQSYNFLLNALKQFKLLFFILLLISVYLAFYNAFWPYLLKEFLDNIASSEHDYSRLALYLIFYSGFNTLILRYRSYVCFQVFPKLKKYIFQSISDVIYKKTYRYFKDNPSGVITTKVVEIVNNIVDVIYIFLGITTQLITIIIVIIAVGISDVFFSEVFLLITSLFLFVGYIVAFNIVPLSLNFISARSSYIGALSDFITNIFDFKMGGMRATECFNTSSLLDDMVQYDSMMQRKTWLNSIWLSLCAFLLELGAIASMLYLLQSNKISVGDCVFVILLVIKVTDQSWTLSENIFFLVKIMSNLEEALEYIYQGDFESSKVALAVKSTVSKIEIKNINMSYYLGKSVLSNVNLVIESGDKIAFYGASGSGKSTLMQLFPRLIDADVGEIFFDGYSTNRLGLDFLRKKMTFIMQNQGLLHRTIRDNITFGNKDVSDKEIIKAAKAAYIHDFIDSLPSGYDTVIGENGLKLSGGQRQRIIIARSLLSKSDLVIMDEPTSALDAKTEVNVIASILTFCKDKTLIVSTHSQTFLRAMDKIYNLHDGTIITN